MPDCQYSHPSASFPPATWRQNANLSLTDHGIMVQQSNLYVTQQAMRLIAVQYRRDLVQLRWQSPAVPWPDNHSAPVYSDDYRKAKLRQNDATFRKARDLVMCNMLKVLRALPIELIGEAGGVGMADCSDQSLSWLEQDPLRRVHTPARH